MKNSSRRKFFKIGIAGATGLIFTGISAQSSAMRNSASLIEQNDINILDFGAVGDGKKINTFAIQKAIDTCAKKGGGRVIVPQGTFLTGSVQLKSKVNLHLLKNAENPTFIWIVRIF